MWLSPLIDGSFSFSQTRSPLSASPPDQISIICLTVNYGDHDELPFSRRRSPSRRKFLLVEMPSENDNTGDREGLLAMYESVGAAASGTISPAAAVTESESRGYSNDNSRRRDFPMGTLARFLCPYYGVLGVGVGTEATSSRSQGSATSHGSTRPPTCPGEQEREKTRMCLALGDPREGMRSPCTLTIKVNLASASMRPPEVGASEWSFVFSSAAS